MTRSALVIAVRGMDDGSRLRHRRVGRLRRRIGCLNRYRLSGLDHVVGPRPRPGHAVKESTQQLVAALGIAADNQHSGK